MGQYEGSWSGMRKYLEQDMLAPRLRGRIRYDCTAYPQANYSSRMFALWVDGELVQRFCMEEVHRWAVAAGRIPPDAPLQWVLLKSIPPSTRTAYMDDEFCNALAAYRQQDIYASAHSGDALVTMFALLDRRLGQRTYRAIPLAGRPDWLRALHHLRGCAEGWALLPHRKEAEK